jgi:hypothetical protein
MTFIDRKTNGQFPGRKKRETNGIRPMRTEMSVVSQSDMYEGANMSNKGLRMSNSFQPTGVMEQAGPSQIAPPGPSSTGLGTAEQQAFHLLIRQEEVKKRAA